MKTTENISLAGYAFVIESDAYDELNEYLNEIRNGFIGDDSAEEIVADIEERIAELLRERCIDGMVVNISMIRDIKKRIGNPKDMAPEESDGGNSQGDASQNASGQKMYRKKVLYRNIDERVIGGVCSGLGTYFGIDKVIFRIIFLILFTIGVFGLSEGAFLGIPVIAYLCLWIAMPAARTAEQKREMTGRPISLDNYRSKDFDFGKEVGEAAQSPAGQTFKRAGGIFLGTLLLLIALVGLLSCIILPSMPEIIGNEFTEEILQYGPMDPGDQFGADLVTSTTFWSLIMIMIGIFCVWFLYSGVMLLFNLKAPSWRPGLVLFISWLLSLFVLIGWVIKMVADALPTLV